MSSLGPSYCSTAALKRRYFRFCRFLAVLPPLSTRARSRATHTHPSPTPLSRAGILPGPVFRKRRRLFIIYFAQNERKRERGGGRGAEKEREAGERGVTVTCSVALKPRIPRMDIEVLRGFWRKTVFIRPLPPPPFFLKGGCLVEGFLGFRLGRQWCSNGGYAFWEGMGFLRGRACFSEGNEGEGGFLAWIAINACVGI